MKTISTVSRVINSHIIKAGSVIYCAGNASTPQNLLAQLAVDTSIHDIEMFSVLLLGEKIKPLLTEERCRSITHRVIFNSHHTREAVNKGWAKYHPIHLAEIPRHLKYFMKPNVVFVGVSGPDNGGNYSLGTTVEGIYAAIKTVRRNGGIVIAERNKQMPFVLGTTIRENQIDFLYDSDYPLPVSPVKHPDELAQRIGKIITALYIDDGCTLQYGIGEVPEAVTEAIIQKGVSDLGIHTELFASAMIRLIKKGVVTNRFKKGINGLTTIVRSKAVPVTIPITFSVLPINRRW